MFINKKFLSLSIVTLLVACSNMGSQYVPVVDKKGIDENKYQQDLAECQNLSTETEASGASGAKKAAGGAGQSAWQVDPGRKQRLVIAEKEPCISCCSVQAVICPLPTGTCCHQQDVPQCRAKAFGNEACQRCSQPTCFWLGNQIITNN